MEVTMKNTKAEIMDAYEQAVKKVTELKSGKTSVAEEVKKKEIKKIKENAKEIIDLGILNDDMTSKYNDLLKAIELLEEEVQEYYSIKKEAGTLEALINAGKDKEREIREKHERLNSDLTERYNFRKKELDDRAEAQTDTIKKTLEELLAKEKEEKILLAKRRDREEEEYKYNLSREKKKENDAWEEEKELREKVLAEKEEAVTDREAKITEIEEEVEALTEKVEDLKNESQAMYAKGQKDGEAQSEKINAIKRANIEKEAKWQAEKLNDKIDAIEAALETERKAHEDCKSKLEKAYMQIQTMATKTVEASRPINMIESK